MLATVSANARNAKVIDVGRRGRRFKIWIAVLLVLLIFSVSRIVSIYLSALWFGSLGYSSVYWYIFKAKALLFVGSAVLTALLLSSTFWSWKDAWSAQADIVT